MDINRTAPNRVRSSFLVAHAGTANEYTKISREKQETINHSKRKIKHKRYRKSHAAGTGRQRQVYQLRGLLSIVNWVSIAISKLQTLAFEEHVCTIRKREKKIKDRLASKIFTDLCINSDPPKSLTCRFTQVLDEIRKVNESLTVTLLTKTAR